MTNLDHQPIVRKLNRRRIFAPLLEMAMIFICVFAAGSLIASACIQSTVEQEMPPYKKDSDTLRDLMNGQRYLIDNQQILTCKITWRKA